MRLPHFTRYANSVIHISAASFGSSNFVFWPARLSGGLFRPKSRRTRHWWMQSLWRREWGVLFWPCLIYIYLPICLTIDRKAFCRLRHSDFASPIFQYFFFQHFCFSVFQFFHFQRLRFGFVSGDFMSKWGAEYGEHGEWVESARRCCLRFWVNFHILMFGNIVVASKGRPTDRPPFARRS